MFTDSPNLEKLAEKIWVFHNFASTEECDEIVAELTSNPDSRSWSNLEHYENDNEVTSYLQIVSGSTKIEKINERLKDFVAPEFTPIPTNSVNRLLPGQSLKPHWDSPGEDDPESVAAQGVYDPYQTCHMVKYGTVVYLSEFEGGELYYPKQGDLEYHPQKGDLVIHSAFEDYQHGVRPVISGERYVQSSFLIPTGRKDLPTLAELSGRE